MKLRAAPARRIGDHEIDLCLSPRARRLRLRVDSRTGRIQLIVPPRTSERRALAWADGHRAWLDATLAALPDLIAIEPGSTIPLFGHPHRVEWLVDSPRRIGLEEGRIVAGGPVEGLEARILRWLRREAQILLDRETRALAGRFGLAVERVGVGDPRSRWGSCSSRGTIRYSWRLIMAPERVRRATVAHEAAHLRHLDHGPDFHALVETMLGEDPQPARLWLRREGAALHRIGRSPA